MLQHHSSCQTRCPSGQSDGLLIHCALHAWVWTHPSFLSSSLYVCIVTIKCVCCYLSDRSWILLGTSQGTFIISLLILNVFGAADHVILLQTWKFEFWAQSVIIQHPGLFPPYYKVPRGPRNIWFMFIAASHCVIIKTYSSIYLWHQL